MKKYMLLITSQYTMYEAEKEQYKEVTFNSAKELRKFLEQEIIWYKEHGYEYISIDVFDEFDNYITTEF